MTDSWTFRARSDGSATTGYGAVLHRTEREVVAALVREVVVLLGADDTGDAAAGTRDATADTAHPFDLSGWSSDPVRAPEDPALRRLFPDAYRDDPERTAEFRRLTECDLRATRSSRLRTLAAVLAAASGRPGPEAMGTGADDLVEMRVPVAQAPQVVAALTDLRLVMAERLGVQTSDDADALVRLVTRPWEQDASDPRRATTRLRATLYLMLGVLQDTLLEAMADGPSGLGSPRE